MQSSGYPYVLAPACTDSLWPNLDCPLSQYLGLVQWSSMALHAVFTLGCRQCLQCQVQPVCYLQFKPWAGAGTGNAAYVVLDQTSPAC